MQKALFVGAVAVLALGACAHMASDGDLRMLGLGPQVCNAPGHHCRPVTVYNGAIVPIEDILVRSPNNQLYWEITTSGYVFPRNGGIQFKDPSVLPRDEFTCNPIGARVFHCVDRNTKKGRYEYKVTIAPASGGRDIVLDPSILND
jgi:hypothetical protein